MNRNETQTVTDTGHLCCNLHYGVMAADPFTPGIKKPNSFLHRIDSVVPESLWNQDVLKQQTHIEYFYL